MTPADSKWRPSEQWVWKRLCEGAIANFNELKVLDPSDPTGWDDRRTVSAAFLETILLQEPYCRALPRQGVRIEGARFEEAIKLEFAHLGLMLWLKGMRFEQEVQLEALNSTDSLSLAESYFAQSLTMSGSQIESHLDLRGAHCTGLLDLNGLEVKGSLFMGEVKSSLFMGTEGAQRAQFADVVLRSARIGGDFYLNDAHCTGKLDMHSLEVKGSLFMDSLEVKGRLLLMDPAAVNLDSARIGARLALRGAHCAGKLDLHSAQIGGRLSLRSTQFAEIDLHNARIGGHLNLDSARCTGPLNLLNAQIGGDLDLRGAHCTELELGGCTYQQLGVSASADSGAEMADRLPTRFIDWLAKDRTFSPQPYQQLASVLRSMGHAETADAVLYAGKERERRDTGWRRLKWWSMSLLNWTIGYGYGYRYFRSLRWVLGITFLGAIILATTASRDFTFIGSLAYSFDLLLPIVELDKRHSLDVIAGWPLYYFYVHELAGYVLGSFIIAGLAGITKK